MLRHPVVITQDAGNPLVFTFTVPDGDVDVDADFTPVFGTPDFILPASLNTIGESAFEGMPLLQIVDAGSVTAIGKGAFRDSGIRQIRLPRDCQIDADAFDGCSEVYVFAPVGGTTEAFCSSHRKVTFVEIQ